MDSMTDVVMYDFLVTKLREYFNNKGYLEVPVQQRLSILAACEDPSTISKFSFSNIEWPLPQTGQMTLEKALLENPEYPGVYCISTSYRNEPNPIPGRHDKIFPMFEFEGRGGIKDLSKTLVEILKHFSFIKEKSNIEVHSYRTLAGNLGVKELTADHEEKLDDIAAIQFFPESSHPFWNMKFNAEQNYYEKIDIILYGMETFGTAVRETDTDKMKERFHSISDGGYKKLLFDLFGEKRVMRELDEYLSLPMTERYGGGIGLTRLARAIKKSIENGTKRRCSSCNDMTNVKFYKVVQCPNPAKSDAENAKIFDFICADCMQRYDDIGI